jgi:N,N-dimethylformamidase
VRPDAVSWVTGSYRHFPVDLYAIEWLEKIRAEYVVSTDDDLDEAGLELLSRHKVVITGSHPEYWTSTARDALERYLAQGGKLMYLGGNGFYWVTSRHPARPWQIEVRRDNTGTRSWDAPLGERVHATNGEIGGIWRQRGKAPNLLVGIGFSAQGWSRCGGYHRHLASYDTEASQFFEGIDEDVVGDRGYILEGAVGDEVDRFDFASGSPPHAVVLASSAPLGPEYQLVIEDQTLILPGQDGPRRPDLVRADMVYTRLASGGEIFSVGSIAYLGAVAWNDPLARLTTNVVRRFLNGTIP